MPPGQIHIKIGTLPADYVRLYGRYTKALTIGSDVYFRLLGSGQPVQHGIVTTIHQGGKSVREDDGSSNEPLYFIELM